MSWTLFGSLMSITVADPCPGPPATSIITPRSAPSAGSDSTCIATVPGYPARAVEWTTTVEHWTGDAASHAAAAEVVVELNPGTRNGVWQPSREGGRLVGRAALPLRLAAAAPLPVGRGATAARARRPGGRVLYEDPYVSRRLLLSRLQNGQRAAATDRHRPSCARTW